jgi:hypothetical protein
MRNDRKDIYWAPRVNLFKVQRLYLKDAQGIYDDELIEEVGINLFLRCESILEYTEALHGRVKCKRCALTGRTTIIDRQTKKSTEILRCPLCAWQVQWRVYLADANKSKGQLDAGHALAAFQQYVRAYPRCRNLKEKVLAIDRLIHEFHWELRAEGKPPKAMRTACVNLLEGSTAEVLAMLDGLAGAGNTAI